MHLPDRQQRKWKVGTAEQGKDEEPFSFLLSAAAAAGRAMY